MAECRQAPEPTSRALAKLQTRKRLIAAAKTLVAERGYEAATLRDVAALAGMSTGAIFANFVDKADLFNEMIVADHALLLDRMRDVAQARSLPSETVLNMLMLGYEMNLERLSLVKAQIGFAWLAAPALEQRSRVGVCLIVANLTEVLHRGVRAGQLPPSLDLALVAQMAWDSYVANYRHAIFDGWSLEHLRSRLSAQIKCLLSTRESDARPARQALSFGRPI